MVLFLVGIVLLIGGAELLVRGASRLAVSVGISPLVVGLTVVAFGTSSPELAVQIQASFVGQADIAIGNVVGSNICNILLVLGLASVVTPMAVSRQLVKIDVPLMVIVSVALYVLASDHVVGRLDGALFFTTVVLYTTWLVRTSRKNQKIGKDLPSVADAVEEEPQPPGMAWLANLGLIVVGLALLVLGARWLVDGAVTFARLFGISELVIGLMIVAVGTSLPEIATSVVAGLKGERDMVVGNVVGSNIFNILAVLGIASLISPVGVSVAALRFDIPIMIAVALLCLPVFFSGSVVSRWEGGLFVAYYAAYTASLVLVSTSSPALAPFVAVMQVALPLSAAVLLAKAAYVLFKRPQPA